MIRFKVFVILALLALSVSQLKAVDASVEIYRFHAQDKSYAEVFFYILGDTSIDSVGNRSVQILYYFTDSSGAAVGDKYNLVQAATDENPDFMDLRRHYLAPGTYHFVASIQDRNTAEDPLMIEREVVIPAISDNISLSDIQIQVSSSVSEQKDKWYKHGRRCIPLPFSFCQPEQRDIIVFTELYNADKVFTEDFYIKYSVVTDPDKLDNPVLKLHKRLSPAPVIPVFSGIDLGALCSGRYYVVAQVFDKSGTKYAEATAGFLRSNPVADKLLIKNFDQYFANSFTHQMGADSLRYVLKALATSVSPVEVEAVNDLLKNGELDPQRRFIHRFWVERSPSDPEGAFKDFMEVANSVDVLYHSGLGYGFETDRGRIFMRYGAPDDEVIVEDEPDAPPYVIWVYYKFPATNQTNVKFLFYDPSLSNYYSLLHSTALGEIQNASWQQILYRDALTETKGGDFIDSAPVADNFNRRAVEYFNDY